MNAWLHASKFRNCSFGSGLFALVLALTTAGCSPPVPSAQNDVAPVPAAATDASPAMDHGAMAADPSDEPMSPDTPMVEATATIAGAFGIGKPVTITLHVRDMMSGKPMGPEAFVIAHTQKIHVMAIDPSLTDYSHSHPDPTATPGEWRFDFLPKFDRPYHLWLEMQPVGGKHAYVMLTVNDTGASAPVEKTPSLDAHIGEIRAHLRFDAPLVAGQAAMGHVWFERGSKPFAALEPVMGAYSHIVAISEDWTTVAHVHPMGAEPSQTSDRGGPTIDFHLEPVRPGFLKVFAQIQVDDQKLYLPFGVVVASSEKRPQ